LPTICTEPGCGKTGDPVIVNLQQAGVRIAGRKSY
jgi:hypothetical protein